MKSTLIIILFSLSLYAQDTTNTHFIGNLSQDLRIAFENTHENELNSSDAISGKKSPFLAALMSFAIPGAGEFYSESYLKAGIFLAIEVAAISIGLAYDKKGDDQTKVFQDYAHAGWDVAKYARWTIDNIEHLNSAIGSNVDPSNYPNLFDDGSRTQVNWSVLNQLESDIGGWYSHRLERFGEQQYYEMIGKYPQFNPGWDDFDESTLYTYNATQKDPVTANFNYYSGLRGEANDFYNIASSAVVAVVVNHFISALDAAWSASRYNKSLEIDMSIEKQQVGFYTDYYPQINMQVSF
jgi:hypothetical protein